MRSKSLAVFALLALALSFSGSAQAQTKSLVWQRYDVDITVQTNGDLRIVETQTIQFLGGSFRYGFATLPTERTEGIADISVGEGDRFYTESYSEAPYTFYTSSGASGLDVYWFFPETGPGVHTYQLAYTVHGALALYADTGDELKWSAISRERDFPVEAAEITIHLPEGAPPYAGRIEAVSVSGLEYYVSPDQRTVTFTLLQPLEAYFGVGIAVAFQHGAVGAPPPAWQVEMDRKAEYEGRWKPLINGALLGLGIMGLFAAPVLLYLLWYVKGRDPQVGLAPEYVSEPPSALAPGLAGTLLDEQADLQDVVATMVDLARRGFIKIEEKQTPTPFGTVNRNFVVRKADEPRDLSDFEQTVFSGLLGNSAARDMQDVSGKFAGALFNTQRQLYQASVKAGFFKSSPEDVRTGYVALGVVLLVMAVVGGVISAVFLIDVADTVVCAFVPLGLLGIGLMSIAHRMPAKTRQGAEEAAKWRAFKAYLAGIEKYSDLKAATDLFEKYLPYAIAFGLERRWVSAFARVPETPTPGWYIPGPMRGPRPLVGGAALGAPAGAGGAAVSVPALQGVSDGLAGGLQGMSDGLSSWLNTASRTFTTPPPQPTYSTTVARGGSRGFTGGSHRSFSGGGGFRSGGFSGGGRRGFG